MRRCGPSSTEAALELAPKTIISRYGLVNGSSFFQGAVEHGVFAGRPLEGLALGVVLPFKEGAQSLFR